MGNLTLLRHACPRCEGDLLWDNLQTWYRCTGCSRKWEALYNQPHTFLREVRGE